MAWGLGCKVLDVRFWGWSSGFQVDVLGFKVKISRL